VPGLAAGASGLREHLAMRVGAGKAAEIAALAGRGAGHEEAHIGGLLRLRGSAEEKSQQRR